jgi:hypothetical protein
MTGHQTGLVDNEQTLVDEEEIDPKRGVWQQGRARRCVLNLDPIAGANHVTLARPAPIDAHAPFFDQGARGAPRAGDTGSNQVLVEAFAPAAGLRHGHGVIGGKLANR